MAGERMLIAVTDRRDALVGIATGLMLSTLTKNNEVAAAARSNLELDERGRTIVQLRD